MACPVAVTHLASNSRRLTAAGMSLHDFPDPRTTRPPCRLRRRADRAAEQRTIAGGRRRSAAGISCGADRRRARESRRAGAAGPGSTHLRAHPATDRCPGPCGHLLQDRHAVRNGAFGEGAGRQPAAPNRRCHAGRGETPHGRPLLCGSRRRAPRVGNRPRRAGSPRLALAAAAEDPGGEHCRGPRPGRSAAPAAIISGI